MTTPIVVPPASPDNLHRCSRCRELKPRSEFSLNRNHPSGLQAWCRDCKRQYRAEHRESHIARDRQHYIDHREERLAKDRKYREEHPGFDRERSRQYRAEHRDELNARRRQWCIENSDIYRERRQRYNARHSSAIVERVRQWRKSNPDKVKATHHRRRARKNETGGTLTAADLAAIRAAQTDKHGRLICWRCNKPITGKPHLDHWIPLDKQGTNNPGNLHYMHAHCNLSKGKKHPIEIGRLL